MRFVAFAVLSLLAGCAPAVHGVHMGGRYVSDDAIEKVKVCETRGEDVLASFGPPTARGRDNDFATYQWIAMTSATDGAVGAMRYQTIQIWVDRSGRVASISVNPTGMPTPAVACPRGGAGPATAASDRGHAPSKAKSR